MISNKILATLESNRGQYVSGAEMARELGVTRSAVWKAVRRLRESGVQIDAVTNMGYKLNGNALSEAGIRKYLKSDVYDLRIYDRATSTNNLARELAAGGAREGTVVIARTQSEGRGRQGRQFYSPDGCGVYFSVLVRPRRLERLLTVTAAVAVAEGIEQAGGQKTSVKWVNDVYAGGKKCCGILTEAVADLESGGIEYAVIGIGINVKTPSGGYGEFDGIAGAALDGVSDALNRTIAAVLDRFWQLYSEADAVDIVRRYKERSFIIGGRVTVVKSDGEAPADVLDIDDDCRLVVRYDDGSCERLNSGEVRLKW